MTHVLVLQTKSQIYNKLDTSFEINVNLHFHIKIGEENEESNHQNGFQGAKDFCATKNWNAEKEAVGVSHF